MLAGVLSAGLNRFFIKKVAHLYTPHHGRSGVRRCCMPRLTQVQRDPSQLFLHRLGCGA
jgi:hypothetical protein